jgi:hypothetical protein
MTLSMIDRARARAARAAKGGTVKDIRGAFGALLALIEAAPRGAPPTDPMDDFSHLDGKDLEVLRLARRLRVLGLHPADSLRFELYAERRSASKREQKEGKPHEFIDVRPTDLEKKGSIPAALVAKAFRDEIKANPLVLHSFRFRWDFYRDVLFLLPEKYARSVWRALRAARKSKNGNAYNQAVDTVLSRGVRPDSFGRKLTKHRRPSRRVSPERSDSDLTPPSEGTKTA